MGLGKSTMMMPNNLFKFCFVYGNKVKFVSVKHSDVYLLTEMRLWGRGGGIFIYSLKDD